MKHGCTQEAREHMLESSARAHSEQEARQRIQSKSRGATFRTSRTRAPAGQEAGEHVQTCRARSRSAHAGRAARERIPSKRHENRSEQEARESEQEAREHIESKEHKSALRARSRQAKKHESELRASSCATKLARETLREKARARHLHAFTGRLPVPPPDRRYFGGPPRQWRGQDSCDRARLEQAMTKTRLGLAHSVGS